VDDSRLTREELVKLGLALPLAVAVAGTETTLAATPSCADDDEPTVEQTEGPYFTPRSPRRRVLRTRGMKGTPFLLTGRVLTTRCRPIPNALLDFWQATACAVTSAPTRRAATGSRRSCPASIRGGRATST
jgi:hypothetical protein